MQLHAASAQDGVSSNELVKESGWQTVQENCTKCHSAQIIVQNSGSREVWKSRIVWMQETQGLGELNLDIENSILDYLAANYGQLASSRRPAIRPGFLPTNPEPNQ